MAHGQPAGRGRRGDAERAGLRWQHRSVCGQPGSLLAAFSCQPTRVPDASSWAPPPLLLPCSPGSRALRSHRGQCAGLNHAAGAAGGGWLRREGGMLGSKRQASRSCMQGPLLSRSPHFGCRATSSSLAPRRCRARTGCTQARGPASPLRLCASSPPPLPAAAAVGLHERCSCALNCSLPAPPARSLSCRDAGDAGSRAVPRQPARHGDHGAPVAPALRRPGRPLRRLCSRAGQCHGPAGEAPAGSGCRDAQLCAAAGFCPTVKATPRHPRPPAPAARSACRSSQCFGSRPGRATGGSAWRRCPTRAP